MIITYNVQHFSPQTLMRVLALFTYCVPFLPTSCESTKNIHRRSESAGNSVIMVRNSDIGGHLPLDSLLLSVPPAYYSLQRHFAFATTAVHTTPTTATLPLLHFVFWNYSTTLDTTQVGSGCACQSLTPRCLGGAWKHCWVSFSWPHQEEF